jgi:mycothiol synthase
MTRRSISGGRLTPAQVSRVLDLAEAAAAADSVAPLSEHVLLHLRYDAADPGAAPGLGLDLLLTLDGEIAGYAYLDPPGAPGEEVSGELVIHPRRRRQGLGLALVRELIARAGGHRVQVWAHGDLPPAAALARAAGFERFRALWQMRRSLRDGLDQPAMPAGTALRAFRPGRDEREWLSLNARAFAAHPEQGAWQRRDLELREQEPWFDPEGFFIAERDGVMTGFHWTKAPADEGEDIGEVYVVGVDPGEQGTGLGRALTLAGLHHLRDRGLAEAMLYVDEDNLPAIRLYEGLGFTRWRTDAMYEERAGLAPGRAIPPGIPGQDRLAAPDAQRLVELGTGQRPVGGRHRGQHLGVELDLVQGDGILNTKVQLPGNRAHLRRRSRLRSLGAQVTCRHCSSA